jgi:hypothetical protein
MTLKKAIKITKEYQFWRKGLSEYCPNVNEITKALDYLINHAVDSIEAGK